MSESFERDRSATIAVELRADDLPKELSGRLNLAVQKAVLTELANLQIDAVERIDFTQLRNPQLIGIWVDLPFNVLEKFSR